MSGQSNTPDGWGEPVNDAVAYPAAFFGARPRWIVMLSYAVAMLAMLVFAIRSQLLSGLLALVAVLGFHVVLILVSHPRMEPFWSDVLGDWFDTPGRIEP